MSEEIVIYECSHIGVAGTTPVHVKRMEDGTYGDCDETAFLL